MHNFAGYFQYAKYIDSVLESRIAALADRTDETGHISSDEDMMRATIILQDVSCQRFLLLAMEQYVNALKFNSKHVYQALPRLLSLWFDFTSFQSDEQDATPSRNQRKINSGVHSGTFRLPYSYHFSTVSSLIIDGAAITLIAHYQVEANELMSKNLRAIPAHCFYTAMPQLVSRVGHGNKDTALVVRAILTRILTKHPGQAMWGLAWLLNSASSERVHIGEDIFKGAQSSLLKRKENKSLTLLSSSKSLFRFLIDLAK
jgi:serine/threonine-protein kinase ATR